MNLFAKDIGIDLGTANVLVYVKNKGIVLKEPSVVAINKNTGKVMAVGNDAKEMLGRTPGNIVAIRPLKGGVIADFVTTSAMLKYFIEKTASRSIISKPRVVICIPHGVTEVEKRAVEEATLQSGAREAYLIEEPMAAAIGANLPVEEPTGVMVVDIGGGTSEIAVISLGGIVSSKSVRVAGDNFDDSIINHIRKQYNLMTGERTAEEIKIKIGSAYQFENEGMLEVCGRDLITGLPKTIAVSAKEIRDCLLEPINEIVDAIKSTLEKTPPELSSDIMDRGITLTGGGALLRGLDIFISKEVSLPVHIAENPLNCVVMGTGRVIDEIEALKNVLASSRKRQQSWWLNVWFF